MNGRYRAGGPETLNDLSSGPDRVLNCSPDEIRRQIIDLALQVPELSTQGWPCGLQTRKSTLFRRLRSIGSPYRFFYNTVTATSPMRIARMLAMLDEAKLQIFQDCWDGLPRAMTESVSGRSKVRGRTLSAPTNNLDAAKWVETAE
jgi:hypothetical protein